MDLKYVQKLVEANLKPMLKELGLDRWSFLIVYEVPDDFPENTMAQVQIQLDYLMATVLLPAAPMSSDDEVLSTLLHELIHVVNAPFDLLESQALKTCRTKAERAMLSQIATHASEMAVGNWERVMKNFKYVYPSRRKKKP